MFLLISGRAETVGSVGKLAGAPPKPPRGYAIAVVTRKVAIKVTIKKMADLYTD